MKLCITGLAAFLAVSGTATAQIDAAAIAKWEQATIIHYEMVGEVNDPHVQIPPTDADLYADVYDRVTLSFDWDKRKNEFVGVPKFENHPGKVTNLTGMGKGCPAGSINGPYEHFDVVEIKRNDGGAIELVGKRVHPETSVAESCGAGRRTYKGADEPHTEYTAAPDPTMLGLAGLLPPDSPIKVTADGKSLVMKAQNNNWIWTSTPTAK
jgi:hypothetical protein